MAHPVHTVPPEYRFRRDRRLLHRSAPRLGPPGVWDLALLPTASPEDRRTDEHEWPSCFSPLSLFSELSAVASSTSLRFLIRIRHGYPQITMDFAGWSASIRVPSCFFV